MQLSIYYMSVPTSELTKAAQEAGEDWLLESDVWIDSEDDRVGRKHSPDDVSKAVWTVFLAKLACVETESDSHRRFRKRCLQLGFAGCWTLHVARAGDSVQDLLEEAEEHAALAKLASCA